MDNDEPAPIVLDLPVPHIHPDASVSTLRVTRRAFRETLVIHDASVLLFVQDATHARALAHALLVAANSIDNPTAKN